MFLWWSMYRDILPSSFPALLTGAFVSKTTKPRNLRYVIDILSFRVASETAGFYEWFDALDWHFCQKREACEAGGAVPDRLGSTVRDASAAAQHAGPGGS